jgi:hypothetical protein
MKKIIRLLALIALVSLPSSLAEAASRFAVCSTTCTWDASSTAMWSASSGGATGASVPGPSDTVTLDAATCVGGTTCTITVNTNPSITTLTMGACTASTAGCILDFSVNNNSLTVSSIISITGTGTRTLKMGSGTFTLSNNNANIWDATTVTNLTLNAGTSTIQINDAANGNTATFVGGGLTYSTLSVAARNNGSSLTIAGANTFASVLISGPLVISVPVATTTINNAISWIGSSSGLLVVRNANATPATLVIASGSTASWAAFQGITFSGSTLTAANSFNLGNNSGATITAPSSGGGRIIGG